MDTPRTTYAMTENKPGSKVSAEIAAALAASSMVFYGFDRRYPKLLLRRASRDELIWAAAWLHKATKANYYWNYVTQNIHSLDSVFAEFGWDAKHAGINILPSKFVLDSSLFRPNANKFVCSVLPEPPTKSVTYSSRSVCYIIK
ncbi:Endoglucanase 4 [Camellia lanceoleosa]|uniref:Endoglucanase 4 n=1 Tax=Camellia lanceoleosa TaxID=1840588 RepID=A0ACC0GYQ2_9ERIC|nr:Endoglucanase 4 [Camellia lanceoleosa]